jgi:hypothetical protein
MQSAVYDEYQPDQAYQAVREIVGLGTVDRMARECLLLEPPSCSEEDWDAELVIWQLAVAGHLSTEE